MTSVFPAQAPSRSLSALPLGAQLGDGGEGTVHEIAADEADAPSRPLVLKRYRGPLTSARLRQLGTIVGMRAHLQLSMASYAWPESLVTDDGEVVGVLMPRAPAPFWARLVMPSGHTATRLREAQYLMFGHDKLSRLGLPFAGLTDRLEILDALVAAVAGLHHHGLVYGDLSARNILYGDLRVFLLDCDGLAPVGAPAVIDSPDWRDPAAPVTAMTETDIYKLGLFAVRLLGISPTATTLPQRGATPAPLVRTLQAALDPAPGGRPSIDDLAGALALVSPGPPDDHGALPHWGLRPGSGEVVLIDVGDRGGR